MSKQVIHKRHGETNKIPAHHQLDRGEIAINYFKGSEGFFIKNSIDEIITFKPFEYYRDGLAVDMELYVKKHLPIALQKYIDGNLSMNDENRVTFKDEPISKPLTSGASAYELYVRHTIDNPVLTEEEWATNNDWMYNLLRTI